MKKAIVFVDSSNWYHNLKNMFKPSDVDFSLVVKMISEKYDLNIVEVRWYSSIPSISDGELMYYNHMSFLSNLRKKGFNVITRKLQRLSTKELRKKRIDLLNSWNLCEICSSIVEESFMEISEFEKKEKGIDVWVAVDIVRASIKDICECVVLISGDADFVPALNLSEEEGKDVLVSSVPRGFSNELRQNFNHFILGKEKLIKCLRKKNEL